MIKKLLIGGTLAAAAGYNVPGLPEALNFSNQSTFASSGAKWEAAKLKIGNISFTSSLGSPRINRGSSDTNSISTIVEASRAELARKQGGSGAKFVKSK